MQNDFVAALAQTASERGLPVKTVFSVIEEAMTTVYLRERTEDGKVKVKVNPQTGEVSLNFYKTVVEVVSDESLEIDLQNAKRYASRPSVGSEVIVLSAPYTPARVTAGFVGQIVIQKLKEAKSAMSYEEYVDKEGVLLMVLVLRVEPNYVVVQIGDHEGILPILEQVPGEKYIPNNNIRVILKSVTRGTRGNLLLVVSRTNNALIERIFEREVPEIGRGDVSIVNIAREPGIRAKVAVKANVDGIDPLGACIGVGGIRINRIVDEMDGESIDLILWALDPEDYIKNAICPAKPYLVDLDQSVKQAMVVVDKKLLGKSIGTKGQNVRLASYITGWDLRILGYEEYQVYILEKENKQQSAEILDILKASDNPYDKDDWNALNDLEESPSAVDVADPSNLHAVPMPSSQDEPVDEASDPDEFSSVKDEQIFTEDVIGYQVTEAPISNKSRESTGSKSKIKDESGTRNAPATTPVSLKNLQEEVWRIRRPRPRQSEDPNQIRFAEDIQGLSGGVVANRKRKRSRRPFGSNSK